MSRLVKQNETSPLGIEILDNLTIKNSILSLWPTRTNDYFPAPLPVSLERSNFYKLKNYPYVISLKSDGIRFLLLSYMDKSYMIDRTFKIFEVPTKFNIHTSNDVKLLLDGELIKNYEDKWVYVIHDCIVMDGIDISKEIFDVRYDHAKEAVDNHLEHSNEFDIQLKKFYKFEDMDKVSDLFKNSDHQVDGLIFTPRTLPIGTQTQYSLFKWKSKANHTFDFKITETDIKFNAFLLNDKKETLYASVDKNSTEGKRFQEDLRHINFKSGDIVECKYDDILQTYNPIMIRYDKKHPNNTYTVSKTILNIKEDIKIEDLVKLSKNNLD